MAGRQQVAQAVASRRPIQLFLLPNVAIPDVEPGRRRCRGGSYSLVQAAAGLSVPSQVAQPLRSGSCFFFSSHALHATHASIDETHFDAARVIAAGQYIGHGSLHLPTGRLVDLQDDGDMGAGDDLLDTRHAERPVAVESAASSPAAATASPSVGGRVLGGTALAVARPLHHSSGLRPVFRAGQDEMGECGAVWTDKM